VLLVLDQLPAGSALVPGRVELLALALDQRCSVLDLVLDLLLLVPDPVLDQVLLPVLVPVPDLVMLQVLAECWTQCWPKCCPSGTSSSRVPLQLLAPRALLPALA
jgi:hypothetical protein